MEISEYGSIPRAKRFSSISEGISKSLEEPFIVTCVDEFEGVTSDRIINGLMEHNCPVFGYGKNGKGILNIYG
jgi:hypothetical protein